jgi:hypothetical protein
MRKIHAVCVAAALLASSPLLLAAETITGEVVEVACQAKRAPNGQGAAHKSCADACAKKGNAMGILTSNGAVIEISGDYAANNNAKLLELVAAQVEATGDVATKDGKKVITVTSMKPAR